LIPPFLHVPASDLTPLAARLLIDDRLTLAHLAASRPQDKVAARINLDALRPLEGQPVNKADQAPTLRLLLR